ncbi:MAG: exodeoxyribonuclease VII large subunit, partial [Terriglobales bacterium]
MEQPSLEFPSARKVWTVAGLLASLKQGLERDYFDVWIEGEVSNFHQSAARHCYFTLKDGQAQLRAAVFAPQARRLNCKLGDGLHVRVRGRISLYEARGDLQCYVEWVEPLGRGELQAAFERLKQTLGAEGLFDPERKRKL